MTHVQSWRFAPKTNCFLTLSLSSSSSWLLKATVKRATKKTCNFFFRGWLKAQHRYSTRFAAKSKNKLRNFCCPFYRFFSYLCQQLSNSSWRITQELKQTTLSIMYVLKFSGLSHLVMISDMVSHMSLLTKSYCYLHVRPYANTDSKQQNFPSQSSIITTYRKRPPLVSDRDYFLAKRSYNFLLFWNYCTAPTWGMIWGRMYQATQIIRQTFHDKLKTIHIIT